ncbi:ParA family protein [uncultured Desulfovibrio sp.]|uniref:ParA family protein n=1 Tax=uncultured Desulfovibrio sp. TaxID=167968 RepID=UPI0025D0606B|nr:ParA family protein [uncultured Desulfovibrio sp.]
MAARILAVANQKGGVGKTTTSLSLGGALARREKRVLVLDLDPHACATLHARLYPETVTVSLYELFVARESEWPAVWEELIHPQAISGMDIAPGSIRLNDLEDVMHNRTCKGTILARALRKVRDKYDFIVLDCPPHMCLMLVNALLASDLLIIPIQTDFLALHGLRLLFDSLHTLNKVLPSPIRYRAVATMYDKRAKACLHVLDLLQKKMEGAIFDTVIGVDTHFREASALGCTIFDIDPKSRGACAYADMAEEVLKLW